MARWAEHHSGHHRGSALPAEAVVVGVLVTVLARHHELASLLLRPAACGLRPAACGLRPAACGLRPAACGL
ncbi:hypothetical protein B1T44_26110, partial [Mycobacterium persicum]